MGAFAAETPDTDATPEATLSRLLIGNERFRRSESNGANTQQRRLEVAAAPAPCAIVLACADSRSPPEIVFDQRLGDLFVVRLAGNVADGYALGSIEFAIEQFRPRLLMVLGHDDCGAVKATLDAMKTETTVPGFVGTIVAAIAPAVKGLENEPDDALRKAVRANVEAVAERLRTVSAVVAEAESRGVLRVIGAAYDVVSGSVTLLGGASSKSKTGPPFGDPAQPTELL